MRRVVMLAFVLAMFAPARAQRPLISTNPETPFKLATFLADAKVRVGIVLGARILDIEGAHTAVIQELGLRGLPAMPRDMRTLFVPKPGWTTRLRVLAGMLGVARGRDHDGNAWVAQEPLEQRLRPGMHSKGCQRLELVGRGGVPRQRALA